MYRVGALLTGTPYSNSRNRAPDGPLKASRETIPTRYGPEMGSFESSAVDPYRTEIQKEPLLV